MNTDLKAPQEVRGQEYRFDAFANGQTLLNKKKNHLPAMGWNSWNAFGSGNTEALTKAMADKFIELGLDKLGYKYMVLDDGCYKPERVNGLLSNDEVKFPSGFRSLADYIHSKGLLFGMYNDIGTNLCAGAAVGTCGHEDDDAREYVNWGVDFLKVDNCYYLWDNATFSDAKNAKYTYAPKIKEICIKGAGFEKKMSAGEAFVWGEGVKISDGIASGIGTFDGTGPEQSPVGILSGELRFSVDVPASGEYELYVEYATGEEVGVGQWLQVAVKSEVAFDGLLEATDNSETFIKSGCVKIQLTEGVNVIRLMNHRRQENTLNSYAALIDGLNKANPKHDVLLSLCEWGKTQPHNWAYKIGDAWRILNDITFEVGADGDPGKAHWEGDYTCAVTAQYDKAVIMDEFSGLSKGWNDPDMMTIGMSGMMHEMNKTHMAMWCMMNSPLMLGLDLRRVSGAGDELYEVIANADLIALNQDALGVQAKRVAVYMFDSKKQIAEPDKEYIRDNNRVDVLAKPLSDGALAISFINVSQEMAKGSYSVNLADVVRAIGHKMINAKAFETAESFFVRDLWTKEGFEATDSVISVKDLAPCENKTFRVYAK